MDRRRFLLVTALTPAAALALTKAPALAQGAVHSFGFAPDGSAFLLDGAPFQIRSGEMHPARIPVEYWRHRIRMAKAMGMNTVSLYVMWNYLEERPGAFDFHTDRRNVEAFVRLCQAEGMWVLLRPGPYVCGEWDLGGIPPYLLRYPDIKLRVKAADDPHYMPAVARYIRELAKRIEPLMIANGGPILMVQIENEYGSYGNDGTYMEELRQLWLDAGIDGPFYTEDGLGQLEQNHTNVTGGAIALSGGDAPSIAKTRAEYPDVPAMAGEVYPGWLTHWGDPTFQGTDSDVSGDLKAFMDGGLSFNLYMIHGGTSFGFFAGANANNLSGNYQPDITSYDYAAPITEQGAAAPHYGTYRSLIADYVSVPPVPPPVPTIAHEPVLPRPYASVWDNLPRPIQAVNPQPMEMYGQNSGFVLYRTTVPGDTGGSLDIRWVHDYATVFVDGTYAGGFSRTLIPDAVAQVLNVTNNNAPLTIPSGHTLDILVEGMGRTNYGQALVDRKGILETVYLDGVPLSDWQTFLLPMNDVRGLRKSVADPSRPGEFFQASVDVFSPGDTYVDLSQWTKGFVWVNGHNLGRYWAIGPQHRLYCPASWLRRGRNDVLILDLHQTDPTPITFERALA
ncbi:MAG TPA: beta-galactosidase [Jatrophihabitantaceae bacterium]|jgi:beta-galactosidase